MTVHHTPPRLVPDVRLVTGITGIAVAVLLVFEFSVRTSMGARPDLDDTKALVDFMTDTASKTIVITVIDTIMMACLIIFHAALRQLIVEAEPAIEWIATIILGTGLVFAAITLVGDSLEGGGALDTVGSNPDPTAIRTVTEGYLMLFGPMTSALIVVMAAASGYAFLAAARLPNWAGYVALAVGLLNLVAIASAFGGTDARRFFSVGGWGVAAFATFPWIAWIIAVSVASLRVRRHLLHAQRLAVA